jgi:hypothetical protein
MLKRAMGATLLLAVVAVEAPAQCPPREVAKLLASDGSTGDHLGWSVAIKDDVIVVGAPEDGPLGEESGSAYVFRRSGNQWVQEAKLIPSDGDSEDYFGWSVATDGSFVVVGAYEDEAEGPLAVR